MFTYEAVFPAESADFYHPFLVGIEECVEEAGCDLLLFTSAKAQQGERRRIFSAESRILGAGASPMLTWTLATNLGENEPLIRDFLGHASQP
ncbi:MULTISPECIES: hypothetical protein [unclassified Nonomuraea]|uniref:hypothetical protein n=1 Tax=unclassified Nonomuraea TaxID=2593643 RepID=UPI0033FCCB3B